MEGKGTSPEAKTVDIGSPLPCPNTVTIRRNPYRRARATPLHAQQCYNSSMSKLREIPPFPHEEILSAQNLENAPSQSSSSSHGKPESENIKVFLRIRPLLNSKGPAKVGSVADKSKRLRAKNAWPQISTKKNTFGRDKNTKKSSRVCVIVNDSHSVTLSTPTDLQESKKIKSETYGGFSHVFSTDSSQLAVYERMVKPMVDDFLSGKSGMLAALGPSGSGKSHTVFGCPREPGMVPLAFQHIFKETDTRANQALRSFYISIFEIYSERGKAEKLFDLLRDGCELSMQQSTVKGLQEVLICSVGEAESLIAQAVLKRVTAMTNTNSQSSRSQCIINVRQKCEAEVSESSNSAVLTIIDLAGAEREKKTGNQGTRFLESNFINNTLMVFGLCLRSLLEHQKNPKKPLQKHFQNSLLTRFLRDYLEGKKRMTLLLTAKSGEEDYLDTSYLLRQASPFMKIKYNEIEPSNIVPNKRRYQASSIVEQAKPASTLGQSKRMRLISSEDSNEERNIKELHISQGDAPRVCASRSECDSKAQSDRSHIIMQNFAKAIWNILKQYNAKLKAAEMEIQSLRESVGYGKEKYQELEKEMNQFKAFCTCRKGSKGCNIYNQETFDAQAPSMARLHSDYEPPLGISCTLLDVENSDREGGVCSSILRHHNPLEVEGESDILIETFDAEVSSEPRHDHTYDESIPGSSCSTMDTEKSNRKGLANSSKPGKPNALAVESKILPELNNSPLPADEMLEPSSPKVVSSTKECDEVRSRHSERRLNNSRNPQKPKRRLMPSTSVLLRDLSNLDLVDETTASKGRKGTQKSTADDVKRTDGSISLIRMLKSNLHL